MPLFTDPDRIIEILNPDRCPLCFIVNNYTFEHLKSLLDECVTDPSTRERLFDSKGFCRKHAWQGVHQHKALGMAIIYTSLLEKGLKDLAAQTPFWKSHKLKLCPICESEKHRDKSCVEEFVHCWIDSENLRNSFSQRGILCLNHLEKTVNHKMESQLRKNLLEMGQKALDRLLQDLNEFLNKQDYHRSQESMGPEWDSWIRAVRMISGERD